MNGVIGVTSTVGAGSVFWIEMLAAAGAVSDEALPELGVRPPPASPNGAHVHTLLYVEDNPANLKLVEQLIARRPDLRLVSAGDGLYGIEIARTTLPDVILMDINLPGISGFEALRILRDDPATSRIPVVALSANAMPRDVERGLTAGFFRYLTKPIKVHEFYDTLTEALAVAAESTRGTH
jgi:CheY-like chemotaxis protein